jgi:hypothetical protein
MPRTTLSLALGLLLFGGLSAGGQTPEIQKALKKKLAAEKSAAVTPQSPLDDLLAKALKDNPDLHVAEAKVQEAQASLNQARLQIVQKIVSLHQRMAAQRRTVALAEARVVTAKRAFENKVTPADDVLQSEAVLQKAKSELAQVEAEMTYLIGQQPKGLRLVHVVGGMDPELFDPSSVLRHIKPLPPAPVRRDMAEKIRKALDVTVKLIDAGDLNVKDFLEYLQEKGDINFHLVDAALGDNPVNIRLAKAVSLGAACQLLEDKCGLRFVVRDYGIMVVDHSAVPPAGAVLLSDFWKSEHKGQP